VTVDLVLVAGGAAAGAFGSLLGLGGGVLIVPLLTLGFGLPLREAVGVSLVSVIVTSSAAAGVYLERHVANLRLGLSVFLTGDVKSAQMLLAEKEKFRDLERTYASQHLDRLAGQTVQSIETSSLHLDIISDMRRINSFFCSTAYPILEQAGQLRKSRLKFS